MTIRFTLGCLAMLNALGCSSPDPELPKAPANVLECSQAAACGIVHAIDGNPALPPQTDYSSDQLCALQELAKGTPVRIHFNAGCEGMCVGKVLLVRNDMSVVVQPYSQLLDGETIDLDGIQVEFGRLGDNELCQLKPKTYFETCMMAFDSSCTYDSNWVTNCVPLETLSCDP